MSGAAGDYATEDDTEPVPVICGNDEHVADHKCVAVPAGTYREAGDNAMESELFLSYSCVVGA